MRDLVIALATLVTASSLSTVIACGRAPSDAQTSRGYCVSEVEFETAQQRANNLRDRRIDIVRGVSRGQFVILPGSDALRVFIVAPAADECGDRIGPPLGSRSTRVAFDSADLQARTDAILVRQPDPHEQRVCIARIDHVGEFSLDLRAVIGQAGLSRIAMAHSDGSLLIASDDSCDVLTSYAAETLRAVRGVDLAVQSCPASSLDACAMRR